MFISSNTRTECSDRVQIHHSSMVEASRCASHGSDKYTPRVSHWLSFSFALTRPVRHAFDNRTSTGRYNPGERPYPSSVSPAFPQKLTFFLLAMAFAPPSEVERGRIHFCPSIVLKLPLLAWVFRGRLSDSSKLSCPVHGWTASLEIYAPLCRM